MPTPDIRLWMAEIKEQPGASAVGMLLAHQGIVRATSRSGEPVRGLLVRVNRQRLAQVTEEANGWPGVYAVRAWVNEGQLAVGDEIMQVLVAGDIRDNVFSALQRLVALIKNEVVSETELR